MSDLARRLANLSPAKRELMERLLDSKREAAEPIAIVGMACRFPGAPDIPHYWRLIHEGTDATGAIPNSRWDVDAFYDPTGEVPGKMSTRWGGFVDDVDQFDPLFFGISPREAEKMDPQQRLLLEVAWEACEYGGITVDSLRGTATGVYVGVGGLDYSRIPVQFDDYFERINVHSGTGNALSIAANRLSYMLDIRGPSLSVDTACSSSLVAVHLAIRSLRSRECDAALAGGVNMILTPETTIAFSKARMLSPDGKCRPFDAQAKGYVRGEGCGIIVLKRLTDAVKSGDTILAVLRGSAVNQDGRTSGITAPNGLSQQAVIGRALADAGLPKDRVSYIEAHGTGTPLGDPIEAQALAEMFRRENPPADTCYLGSVKANIGHTETAAGIASLIKVVLMMQHRLIPGQLYLNKINPHISLKGSRLEIPQGPVVWDCEASRIAGVSAFGFGGTNAHIVLEEAPPAGRGDLPHDRPRHVITLSAKSDAALRHLAQSYSHYLEANPATALADFGHTVNAGRCHFHHRAAFVTDSIEHLRKKLDAVAAGTPQSGARQAHRGILRRPQIAFLFAGQGAQYVGMGRGLFETQPVFRKALSACDEILREYLDRPLLSILFPGSSSEASLDETLYTQPALFAIEYALAVLWRSWGIEPRVLLGHSVGEYVAACVAEVCSLEDGLRLVAGRARLMQDLPRNGLMAIVFAPTTQVVEMIADKQQDVSIAAANGPENTVVSGRVEAVCDVVRRARDAGLRTQRLNVSHAFHSPLMEPILDDFEDLAADIDFGRPKIPIASNLTGELISDQPLDVDYWRRHIRQTVRFADGVSCLADESIDAIVEIGPSTSSLSMARRCWGDAECAWLPSLRKGRNDWDVIQESLSELYRRGADVDWQGFDSPWPRRRLALPTYPFERSRHWYAPGASGGVHRRGIASGPSIHPLLGNRLPTALSQTIFETIFSDASPAYLKDHQLQGSAVVPAAAFVEQALAAAEQVFGAGSHTIRNLSIQQALMLPAASSRALQISVSPENKGLSTLETYSRPVDAKTDVSWQLHACTTLQAGRDSTATPPQFDVDRLLQETHHVQSRHAFYTQMAERELVYGPAFQVLDQLKRGDSHALAAVQIPPAIAGELEPYHLHPAILDGCLQAMAGAVPLESDGSFSPYTYVPTFVREAIVFGRPTEKMWTYVVRTSSGDTSSPETVEADVYLLDETGTTLARLRGVRIQRVGRPGSRDGRREMQDWIYRIDWQPQPPPSDSPGNGRRRDPSAASFLLFADRCGVAAALASKLRDQGANCALVYAGNQFRAAEDAGAKSSAWEIDPRSAIDYERLMASWCSHHSGPLNVVHLWSLNLESQEGSLFAADGPGYGCGSVLQLLKAIARIEVRDGTTVQLITRGTQRLEDSSPIALDQSPLWGMGRVAANELPDLRCRLIDLDSGDATQTCADRLATEIRTATNENQVAYRDGQRFVARLARAGEDLVKAQQDTASRHPRGSSYRLGLQLPGSFDSLHYQPLRRRQPGRGQVEIEVACAGLNFSDVLKAMGLYPGITDDVVPLGIECSGTVTAVGEEVSRFQVGDAVMGVAPYSFASHAVSADYALVKRPSTVSDEEACTIPITFLTAYYALHRLAHLQRGERLLIHAGAGGVGLAAIQIAQHVGAEVFATAGSDAKRDHLRSLGVEHVMNSRTLEFADQIMAITDRQGVDVVLNSLPGEAITKSLSVLSAYGRFLEIGKTDIYQNRMIGLLPFQDNLSYFAIDLDRMLRQRPDYIREMFAELMEHFENGPYRPLPLKRFSACQVGDAFRYMAQRRNIGKVVVSLAKDEEATTLEETSDGIVAPQSTYLITGGFGALGLQVAAWLIDQGAEQIALMSRRPPDEEVQTRITSLRDSGATIVTVEGDVCDLESLQTALAQLPGGEAPLRGVFHAAGVLADGLIYDMDQEQLDRAMAPKTRGAWNLHLATRENPLDHFVLFSSVASLFGSPGQANYAAGNAYLDGLAHYRRQRGLPATSINWGPWAESGMAARGGHGDNFRGITLLQPQGALAALGAILSSSASQVAVMDVDWSELLSRTPRRGAALLERVAPTEKEGEQETKAGARDVEFCARLEQASPDEREELLREFVSERVAHVLGIESDELDVEQPLSSLGLDSLMGMELKVEMESRLGLNLPMAGLMEGPSVTSLADLAAKALQADASADAVPSETAAAATPESWSPLIPLASQGAAPPLFCVHPVGGDVRCYFDLARQFAKSRPVYALRARGTDGTSPPHSSIEEMTEDYIAALRTVQPHGPYFLAGWSTGGIFAYEMARQLHGNGDTIGALVFIDTPTPNIFRDVNLDDHARFLFDLVNFSNWFAGTQMKVDYDELRSLDVDASLQAVLHEAKRHEVLPTDAAVDHLRRLIDVCRENVRTVMEYVPVSFGQSVELFRPEDTSALSEASGQTLTKDLGWRDVLGDLLTTRTVPGDHFSMMTSDYVRQLADILAETLARSATPRDSMV